jgi:hypothetical protein
MGAFCHSVSPAVRDRVETPTGVDEDGAGQRELLDAVERIESEEQPALCADREVAQTRGTRVPDRTERRAVR